MEEAKLKTNESIETDREWEEEAYGWEFHKWPFLIAAGITVLLYLAIWIFVDREPPYIDPTELPLPPGSF